MARAVPRPLAVGGEAWLAGGGVAAAVDGYFGSGAGRRER